ncbi:MAG: LuxR C-terminal-related transcriptional regulator [Opitutaceae bacterium]
MPFSLSSRSPKILIVKSDILYAGVLQAATQRVFPTATFRREVTLKNTLAAVAEEPVDLLITGVSLPDGDTLDLLAEPLPGRGFGSALVVTGRREHRIFAVLRGLAIQGVFDPNDEGLDQFEKALEVIRSGGRYWSTSVLERLHVHSEPSYAMERLLSPTEQLVLAVIGDGSDDHEAGDRLNLRPSTIHSVRRDLHRKLGVRHRGELVRLAAQQGYVRFTAGGVQRPGFARLLAACGKNFTSQPARAALPIVPARKFA